MSKMNKIKKILCSEFEIFKKTVFCEILQFRVFFFNLDLNKKKNYIDIFTLFKNRRLFQRLSWVKWIKLKKFYVQNLNIWKTLFCKILQFTVFSFNLDLNEDKIFIEFFTLYRGTKLCQALPLAKLLKFHSF